MRHAFLCLLLPFFWTSLPAQVVDRYPYIQRPTESSVLVAWNTATAATGTLSWGVSPAALVNTLADTGATQKHALKIDGLLPNTQYYYQVATDAGYISAVEHFFTAKPVQTRDIRFLQYGDCGYNNTIQNQIAALMENEAVDFAVVCGDVDQGVGDAYDNVFFGPYKNMLARDCHYTAIGNHDIIANNGVDFFDAFYQPTNNPQQSEHYYTFTWGHAKFICLDSNGDLGVGSDQHDFLLDELRCRDQEWVAVFFHHPPWTNAWDPSYYVPFQSYYQYDGEDAMRTNLVPYFEQYGVDFVLNGHSHCYQRGKMNGVEYVISGGAGTSTPDTRKCNTFPNFGACAPNIQNELYINQYVRFAIHGDTATYVCIDPAGQVVDSTVVIKTWTAYQPTFTTTGASAGNAADGTATVSVVGPHPPYSFVWSTGDTSSAVAGLLPTAYYVTITDAYGCAKVESVSIGIEVGAIPAVASPIQTYPNPFRHRCRIDFPNPGHQPCDLELVSVDGKVVRRIEGVTSSTITIDGGAMEPGIYLVRIQGKGVWCTGKIMMQ